ncbi:hypothetical protein, partial [Cohnella zeiphila]|uniref:hypothetical protein n=1 Tax=Cohnella zeiphila TaxID=2761120 RepID=UPI001EE1A166
FQGTRSSFSCRHLSAATFIMYHSQRPYCNKKLIPAAKSLFDRFRAGQARQLMYHTGHRLVNPFRLFLKRNFSNQNRMLESKD